jgi:hypothetical protein
MDSRAEFEAWCRDTYLCTKHTFSIDGGVYTLAVRRRYESAIYASVQMLWEAWQASRAAMKAMTQQEMERVLSPFDRDSSFDDIVRAVENHHGIKP